MQPNEKAMAWGGAPVPGSAPYAPRLLKRHWRGNPCACCGECEIIDVGSCCIVYWCPCIAFGQNMRRALSLSMWAQGLVMVVCLGGLHYLVSVFASMDCGVAMLASSSDAADATPPAATARRFLSAATSDISNSDEALAQYESCEGKWNVVSLLCSLAALGFLVYAGWRRNQMRTKFNIPGDVWEDYFCWLCCWPCVLCQETRTLAHASVEDGVWPDAEMEQPILQAPVFQQAPPPPHHAHHHHHHHNEERRLVEEEKRIVREALQIAR